MKRHRLKIGTVVLSLACGVLASSSIGQPVRAATSLTVTTDLDGTDADPSDGICASSLAGSPCTLRAAIQTANALPGPDQITISPSPGPSSPTLGDCRLLTLTIPGADEDDAATGDLDITDPLSISADCGASAVVDASGNDRAFDIYAPTTLSRVGAQHGDVSATMDLRGAGIAVHKPADLQLARASVIDNGSTSPATIGGGIYAENETAVTVTESTISRNTAGNGGGIYTAGTLTISGSITTIADNTAELGAAIFLGDGAIADISNVNGTSNVATTSGGFLFASARSATRLWSDVLESNEAGPTGGTLQISADSDVGIVDTRIGSSHADEGGAVFNSGSLTVINSGIIGAAALAGNGGAIYNDVGARIELQRSVGTANTANSATANGGFLYNLGRAVVTNTSIHNGSVDNQGAGIWTAGPVDLTFSTIAGNSVNVGPGNGLFVQAGTQDVNLTNSVIVDSNVGSSGPPLDCFGSVRVIGALLTEDAGGCVDDYPVPGGGARLVEAATITLSPSSYAGRGAPVPQVRITNSPASLGAGDPALCAAVGVDGTGMARPAPCDLGASQQVTGAPSALSASAVSDSAIVDPAFDSLPLRDLPTDAITGALGTGVDSNAQAAPLARVDFAQPLSGTAEPQTTPLARVPLARVPLARVPLARVPLARVGLAQIPLARVPLARVATDPSAIDTWEELLAGSLLLDRPLASITFADVFDRANWSTDAAYDTFVARFESLTLDQIDLSSTIIGRLPVDAIGVADVPLADLPIDSSAPVPTDPNQARSANLQAWCAYFASVGFECAATFGIDPNQPAASDDINLTVVALVGVPLARVPLARVPLARVPLARVPILNTPLARVDYQNTPLARVPLARVDLTQAPLARVPLARVPLARVRFASLPLARVPLIGAAQGQPPDSIPGALLDRRLVDAEPAGLVAVVDCRVVDCADPGATMRTAFEARDADGYPIGIRFDATVDGLLGAYPTLTLGEVAPWIASEPLTSIGDLYDLAELTVAELIAAIGPPEIDEITLGAILNGFVAREDVAWDDLSLKASSLAGVAVTGGNIASYSVVVTRDPTRTASDVVNIDLPEGWRLVPGGIVVDGLVLADDQLAAIGGQVEFSLPSHGSGSIVRVATFTGLTTGDQEARFTVTPGQSGPPAVITETTNTVTESFEPNDTPAQAAVAVGGTAINPDELYVSTIGTPGDVDLWPVIVPRGYELSVAVSGMSSDYDIVVYSPPGATEDPLVDLPGGLRQAPERSLPYLPDFGLGLGRDDTRVQPERLQDIPLEPGREVYAASVDRGTAPERVDTPALGGGVYLIQVTGYNGASSRDPYSLRASVRPGIASTTCASIRPPFLNEPAPSLAGAASGATTLFVLNSERLTDTWGVESAAAVYAELNATITAINADPAAFGGGTAAALDLATIGPVGNAYVAWDAARCEPAKANGVVRAIGAAIDAAAVANGAPFDNIVLLGADDIIPMARVVDGTTLGNEREYARGFNASNELVSSLSFGTVLTDDPYGDARPVAVAGRELYVPELAVGRLVEQPEQIVRSLATYRTSSGILDASTAAITGYDFLSDGASAVEAALSGVRGGVRTSLISDAWSKADLDGILSDPANRILSINAHFDNNQALPADQNASGMTSDPVDATDLADVGGRRLLFSMGCHAGLSVSDVTLGLESNPDDALKPDWAQQLAANGDLLVGNTGYGYGDTDIIAASEKLMTFFAQRLDGSVTIGDALQLAKQRYSADLPVLTPYDEKVLQQVVMYGLPMYRLGTASGPPRDRPDGVVPTGVPGGLQTTTFDVDLNIGADGDPATADLVPTTTDRGTYWTVDEDESNLLENTGRVLTAQYRPVQPQYAVEATDSTGAAEARGAIVTSLASTDIGGVNPVNYRPTVDLTANEPEPAVDDAAFPDRIQGLTSFSDDIGDRQQLILSAGQFLQNPAAVNGSGTQRLYSHIGGTIYYSSPTNPDLSPPTINHTEAGNLAGSPPTFVVDATDDSAIERVVVLSTAGEAPGTWQTTDLQLQADGSWKGTAAAPSTGAEVLYLVQVLDENGNVAVSSNKALNFLALPQDLEAPTISATAVPSGLYSNQPVTVTISAADGVAGSGVAAIAYTTGGVTTTVANTAGAEPFAVSTTITTPGTSTITYSAVDNRGNRSATASINVGIDTQQPTIAIGTPTQGATYSFGQVVLASYSCADPPPGSGVASTGCIGSTMAGVAIPTSTSGSHTFTVTATDMAANLATASVTYNVLPQSLPPAVRADWGQGARDVGFLGSVATIDGSFTDVNDAGPWTITVDYGNGKKATSTVAAAGPFRFTSPSYAGSQSVYTVKVKICDAANLCGTDTVKVRLRVSPSPLRPSLACVVDGGPSTPHGTPRYTARFSWNNLQTYWIHAPVGVYNMFVLVPQNQGQPVLFAPGTSASTVNVPFDVGAAWNLGAFVATATLLTPRCP